MTERRTLTTEEATLCNNSLDRLFDEANYQEYLIDYANLMLEKGLAANYNRQKEEWEAKLSKAKKEYDDLRLTIQTLKDHLMNGVPLKDPDHETTGLAEE